MRKKQRKAKQRQPKRSPGNVAISVSMTRDLLERLDARAAALGFTRSQLFVQLARADIQNNRPLNVQPDTAPDSADPPISHTKGGAA